MARIVSYATAFMLIVALLLAGPPGVFHGAAASDESVTVTRGSLPDRQCGESIQVTLSISWSPQQPGSGAFAITETYPSGWTVTDNGWGDTSTSGKIKWFSMDTSETQVTYTLAIPGDASGTHTFSGEYRDHNMESGSPSRIVEGSTSLEVNCTDPNPDPDPGPDPDPDPGPGEGTTSVDRRSMSVQQCGQMFFVHLDLDWGAERDSPSLFIEETYPEGWTVSFPTNGGNVETPGKIKWFLTNTDLSSVNYRLTPPADASGSFGFSGEYRDDTMSHDEPHKIVGGQHSVSVSCGGDPDPSTNAVVIRDEMINSQCGESLTVWLLIDWNGVEDVFIAETYPSGWTVTGHTGGGNTGTAGQVKWALSNPSVTAVSYTLAIPESAEGDFGFTGNFRDSTMAPGDPDFAVGGDDEVTVSCSGDPDPGISAVVTRDEMINSQCGESLTVWLLVDWNDAQGISINETYPEGWTITGQTGGGDTSMPGHVKWVLTDSTVVVVSYTLAIPESAGGFFGFTGSFRDSTLGPDDPDLVVGGDDEVTIMCEGGSDPDPDPSDASVNRVIPTICMGPFTVSLVLEPPAGTTAWIVDEEVPAGLAVSAISNGGTYNATQGKIKWVSTDGDGATLTYNLTIPDGTPPGTVYDWNGTFRFDPSMSERANITGATSTATSCEDVHPYDADQNCVFNDTELFSLIDAWKAEEATDDELFSGIAHWKLSPGTYCEE